MTTIQQATDAHRPARGRVMSSVRPSLVQESLLVVSAWLATGIWVWLRLDQGWVGHDDGAFAQSATRVLAGELPHREFAELYTGGMTFLNAGVMAVFGEDLIVLRYPLFIAFLLLVPATYYVARSFAHPLTAAVAATAAATWSVPVYPAAVPSWYLLVFSMCGTACLVRWSRTRAPAWLFVAGLFGGLAVAFKIVGVYFVVAALLFLIFGHGATRPRSMRRRIDPIAAGGALLAVALVTSVLGTRYAMPEILNFAVPVSALLVALLAEPSRGLSPDTRRSPLAGRLGAFFAGVSIPLIAVAVPYVLSGSVRAFGEGLFLSPQSRRDVAYFATPVLGVFVATIFVVAIWWRSKLLPRTRAVFDRVVTVSAVVMVIAAGFDPSAYKLLWAAGRGLAPVIVVVASVLLVRRRWAGDGRRRELVFLTSSLVAFTALVQFPFGRPIYYCYLAPLVIVAALAVFGNPLRPQALLTVLLGVAALFGALYLDRTSLYDLGTGFVRDGQTERLDADRASIRVYPAEARTARTVVRLLRARSSGEFVFAGPDLPQLYVLADLRNPTRSLFDFLDRSNSARGDELLRTLVASRVTAIAINRAPDLSAPLEPATLRSLAEMFPNRVRVGGIDVRWRDTPCDSGCLRASSAP